MIEGIDHSYRSVRDNKRGSHRLLTHLKTKQQCNFISRIITTTIILQISFKNLLIGALVGGVVESLILIYAIWFCSSFLKYIHNHTRSSVRPKISPLILVA